MILETVGYKLSLITSRFCQRVTDSRLRKSLWHSQQVRRKSLCYIEQVNSAVTCVTCIRDTTDSNLGPEIDLLRFIESFQANTGWYIKTCHNSYLLKFVHISYDVNILSRSCIVSILYLRNQLIVDCTAWNVPVVILWIPFNATFGFQSVMSSTQTGH
jgi:hypothetical protein